MPANYAIRPEWRVAEEEEGGETADDSSSADDAERSSEKDSLYTSAFYPMQLAVVTVADNPFAAAWWTPISKEPFRFALAVDRSNYSLDLLREHGEAALNFLPFEKWKKAVGSGYDSGRRPGKAGRIGLRLAPAEKLATTQIAAEAETVFELRLESEVEGPQADHALLIFEVLAVHGTRRARERSPIFFLGGHDIAPIGERMRHRLGRRKGRRQGPRRASPEST